MKPTIQITVIIDTLAHASTIKDNIQSRLVGKDIFKTTSLSHGQNQEGNGYLVSAEIRFNGNVDRDDIVDWLKDQIQNHPQVKTWISYAKVTTHDCSHDDLEVRDCRTTNLVEWTKG